MRTKSLIYGCQIDNIYTPPSLATAMLDASGIETLGIDHCIADFSAGNGELVAVAHARWPYANIIATDIDPNAIRRLRHRAPQWQVGVCNFLNPQSRRQCLALKNPNLRVNLLLLNPPFSCRGGRKVHAEVMGYTVQCSIGMAFVINSIEYLASESTLIAVLPSGSMTSEKDAESWELLRNLGSVEIVMRNSNRTFPSANVDTIVMRWVKSRNLFNKQSQHPKSAEKVIIINDNNPISTLIIRGSLQIHKIRTATKNEGIPLIHTTELRDGGIIFNRYVCNHIARLVRGPSVLIPRVGNPNKNKIVCYTGKLTFAISDCVFAVLCSTPSHAEWLRNTLHGNWSLLKQAYVGSGAKYMTIHKLSEVLKILGCMVSIHSTSYNYRDNHEKLTIKYEMIG